MSTLMTYKATKLTPVHDHVIVTEMEFGERLTNGGIIVPGDNCKSAGIRPRWGKVFAIGPKQTDVQVDEYVLVKHGRWTRGIDMNIAGEDITVRLIDNDDILLVSADPMNDDTFSEAMSVTDDTARINGSLHNDGTQSDV